MNKEIATIIDLISKAEEVTNLYGGKGYMYRTQRSILNAVETWFLIPDGSSIGSNKHAELETFTVLWGELEIAGKTLSSKEEISFDSNEEHWICNNSKEYAILYSKKITEKE